MSPPPDLEARLHLPEKPQGKLREWFNRYAPAEIAGTATALLFSFLAYQATDSEVAAAYAGTMGENLGFYGTIISREVWRDYHAAHKKEGAYGIKDVLHTAKNMITEFGPAGLLDSLVVRPLTMGLGGVYLERSFGRNAGVFVGKLAADFIFYIPTIASYEFRKHAERKTST